MPAIDHAEAEYPIAEDPYPGRARIRRTGWYLRLPAGAQIAISSVGGGSADRAFRSASTRVWLIEARMWAAIALRDTGDAVHVEAMRGARSAEWSRERPPSRRERARKARREYEKHRAERRVMRAEIDAFEQLAASAASAEVRAGYERDIAELRTARRVGFSRHAAPAVTIDPTDDLPF